MTGSESQRPRPAPSIPFKAGLAAAAFVAPVVVLAGRTGDPWISVLCGLVGGAIAVPVSALIDRHARTTPLATRTYGLGLGLTVMAAGFLLIFLLASDVRAAFYYGGWYAGTAEIAEIWFALRRRHARPAAGTAGPPGAGSR
jgi:hypothetical protein